MRLIRVTSCVCERFLSLQIKVRYLILNKYRKYYSPHILNEFDCPSYVVEHSKAVMLKAIKLSENFEGRIDLDLLKAGAMLHDVGRCQSNGIDHAIVGVDILKKNKVPLEIIKIVERHIGSGITRDEAIILGLPAKDYMPVTLEEKLVAHADNLIHGTHEVDLDFVIRKWQKKMGINHPSITRLIELHAELTDKKQD